MIRAPQSCDDQLAPSSRTNNGITPLTGKLMKIPMSVSNPPWGPPPAQCGAPAASAAAPPGPPQPWYPPRLLGRPNSHPFGNHERF